MASTLMTAALAAAGIAVYPAPGVGTASPTTQISFRGTTELGTVTVTGSRSGRHQGRVRQHSDGLGASWLPNRRFTSGETVKVRSAARSYSFRIGRRPTPVPMRGIGRDLKAEVQALRSRPDLAPPRVLISTSEPGHLASQIFLGPKGGRQMGPMVIDDRGRIQYFRTVPSDEAATDVRVQTYRGQQVLTWWQGKLTRGSGRGAGMIFNTSYELVKRVRMGNGFHADLHEFTLTPHNTALLVGYDGVFRDGGRFIQAVVQEIDIATGLVLFEWHSAGNVATADTYRTREEPRQQLDYVHVNSVALDTDGNFILSGRGTDAVYKVSRATGRIIWQLGGKKSDFTFGPGARFVGQHDARPGPDNTLTIFDNAKRGDPSRALTLKLDGKRATVVRSFTHARRFNSANQGGMQPLPNGNVFVGWGSQRIFTEFDANGRIVFEGRISRGMDNYRAYRGTWAGMPKTRPKAVRSGDRLYVSWNGATQVAAWQVGDRTYPWTGFETSVPAPAGRVAVQALDTAGNVLGEARPA